MTSFPEAYASRSYQGKDFSLMLFPPEAGWGEQGAKATVEGGTGIPSKEK